MTPLEIEFSGRTQRRALIALCAFPLLIVVTWVGGTLPAGLAVAGLVVSAGIIVLGIVEGRRLASHRPAARLDADGITVAGATTVPWSDLTGVLVGPLCPRWLVGARSLAVVAFLPRPGVHLPGPPQPSGRPLRRAERFRERVYGTNLLLPTSALSVGPDAVAEAAHELGGLPVRRERFRGVRDWVLLLLLAAVLGALVAVVRHLSG